MLSFLSKQSLYADDELNEILVNLEDHFDNYLNRFKGERANFEKDNLDYFNDGIIGFNTYTHKLREYLKKLDKYSA